MPLSPDDVYKVWHLNELADEKGADSAVTPANALEKSRNAAEAAVAKVDGLAAKVDALTAAVAALHVGGVDMDALSTAVADKLAARLQS